MAVAQFGAGLGSKTGRTSFHGVMAGKCRSREPPEVRLDASCIPATVRLRLTPGRALSGTALRQLGLAPGPSHGRSRHRAPLGAGISSTHVAANFPLPGYCRCKCHRRPAAGVRATARPDGQPGSPATPDGRPGVWPTTVIS